MKRKYVWLLLSCLMVSSMVLTSCAPAAPVAPAAPAAPTTATPTTPTTTTAPVAPTTPVTPAAEKPKYGGVYTFADVSEGTSFDGAYRGRFGITNFGQTNGALITGDWSKGPAGGGGNIFENWNPVMLFQTGEIAESWEIVGDDTVIFHIRKGIHWAVDPDNAMSRLVGGRELDAYDVEFNIKRNFNMLPTYPEPNAYALVRLTPNEYPVSVTVTDKWTVMLKGRAGFLGSTFYYIGQAVTILAPEVVKAGKNFEDLKNYVSNGPFILKDYVRASATTFIRNPNYWRKDPVGPGKGNQLPYLDGVKYLIIPDVSTRVAALRTSKTDSERLLSQENADSLLKTSPQLLKTAIVKGGEGLALMVDKPELPWYDKRVRQALQMALDRETIIRDYYTGKAEIFNSPTAAFSTWKSAGAYIPLEQLPASARELYKYNPTKAKQLLAEAGYPKGFKMEVITQAATIDELTIIKEQFAKIGVDVEIQVKETGVYTSISRGHTNKHALYGGTGGTSVFDWENYRFGSPQNTANVNDAVVNEGIAEFAKYYMLDDAKAYPIIGKFVPYIVEQSWYIYFPSPYTYTLWWPWVKNFHGEWVIGVAAKWGFTEYIWIDQSLKKSMGF